jgi:hypothetical protein
VLLRRSGSPGLETSRQHRPDSHPDGYSDWRPALACSVDQYLYSSAYVHARASHRSLARYAHSICSTEPDANLHRYADADFDTNIDTYHNIDANIFADSYVNCDLRPNSDAHGYCSFADANGSNSHPYAPAGDDRAAHLDFDYHSHRSVNFYQHLDPNQYADYSALKECIWI